MKKLLVALLFSANAFGASFSFPEPAFIYDSAGNPLASTSSALNAFLTNSTLAVTQSGTWTTGRTWTLSSGTDSCSAVQSGTWTTGRTWNLNSSSDSVSVNQGLPGPSASPWPVALISPVPLPVSQSGTWTTGRTWTANSSTDSISSVQSGTWTTGRTWTTNSATDSVTVAQGTPGPTASPWPITVVSPAPPNDIIATGTLTSLSSVVSLNLQGSSSVTVDVSGPGFVGTIMVQLTTVSQSRTLSALALNSSAATGNITTNGSYRIFGIGGGGTLQVIFTSYTSGSANIGIRASTGTFYVNPMNFNAFNNLTSAWLSDGAGNLSTIKLSGVQPTTTDTALVVTRRPDNAGTPTQTSVACANSSTTLLAAGAATNFVFIRNPTTATNTIWIQMNGSAATAAVPSVDIPPGGQAAFFAYGASYLPTSQFNCISGGTTSSVALIYK